MLITKSYKGKTVQFTNDFTAYVKRRDQLVAASAAVQRTTLPIVYNLLTALLLLSMNPNTDQGSEWRENNLVNIIDDLEKFLQLSVILNNPLNPNAIFTQVSSDLEKLINAYRRQYKDQSCCKKYCVVL